jgi:hypothetical protein
MRRIRAGYCTVVNPYNPTQIARVELSPDAVRSIVFWTRNPKPLIGHLRELSEKGYFYYFLITLTGYPRSLETHTPLRDEAIASFIQLSKFIGAEKVIWRYDPVILSNVTDVAWHKKNFAYIARHLKGYTRKVIISVLDPYQKTRERMVKETPNEFMLDTGAYDLGTYIQVLTDCCGIAEKNKIKIQACGEDRSIYRYGIQPGKCIDDELIAEITGTSVSSRKDPSQRKLCLCIKAKDIGAPNSCIFGCRYCYATKNIEIARKNYTEHKPDSPSIMGWFDVPEQKEIFPSVQEELF